MAASSAAPTTTAPSIETLRPPRARRRRMPDQSIGCIRSSPPSNWTRDACRTAFFHAPSFGRRAQHDDEDDQAPWLLLGSGDAGAATGLDAIGGVESRRCRGESSWGLAITD